MNQALIVHNKNKSDYKFLINWSAKSGCTTICKIFFNYMDILQEALEFSNWIHNYRQHFYYKKYGRADKNSLLSNEFIKIKFVRNPYSRAVSSYIHVMKTRLREIFFKNQDMSFYTFLLAIKKKEEGNEHWTCQTLALEKKNTFDHIIKIENLEKGIKKLETTYNLNLNLSSLDLSSSHHIVKERSNRNVCYVKFSEILKIPSYNNFYDEKTKNLVDEIFERDIIGYNYTFEEFLNSEK